MEKKVIYIFNEIKQEILQGKFGCSGEKFISVRELCDLKQISLVSSFKICNMLENDGLLFLHKSTRFLTIGKMESNTPLSKVLKKKPKLFGIHVKEINNPYICSIVGYMKKELDKRGYMVTISTSEGVYADEKKILKYFISIGCSYVIDFPSPANNNELNEFYNNYPLPLLFVGRTIPNTKALSVVTDNRGTGLQIANYLIDCGYTTFYFMSLKISREQNQRFLGFEEGLKQYEINLQPNQYVTIDYDDKLAFNSFVLELKRLVQSGHKIGVFCLNDILAVNLLNASQKHGINIPNELGIIGYDNLEISQYASPPLTTVSYNYKELAEKAIDFILFPESYNNTKNYIINNNLTIRRSTTHLYK